MANAVAPLAANMSQTAQHMTGEDFSKRLTEAVENMTHRLGEATTKLSGVLLSFEEAGMKARENLAAY
jgi:hypothetical protein